MNDSRLPDQLKLGVATAATHIEGGELNHNWYRWSELGKIKDGSHSKVACDHIHRIEEDVQLITDLGCQTYRMGLEWARIEPEEGQFSQEGIAVYRRELELLKVKGIEPLVTLWHFSNPLWMEDDGAWIGKKAIPRYQRYVEFVVQELGDLVSHWITINEPNVYLFFAYFDGIWPPGHHGDIRSFLKGASNFCHAHIQAYKSIKALQPAAKIGVAHHLRVFEPVDERWLSRKASRWLAYTFQELFLDAMTIGKFGFPLKGSGLNNGLYADFVGINYYSRDMVKGVINPFLLFGERSVQEGAQVNDLGWEIYPEGLGILCKSVYEKYQLPIYITENGVCDSGDVLRKQFLRDHLQVLTDCIREGVDVERYYHWSLLDNFEWAEGNSARFGLYHTNYNTQERTLRESGKYFQEICRSRRLIPLM